MDKILKNKVMVQIGTNDGNDKFRDLVVSKNPSKVILIEPNSSLINKIKENYKDIPNVIIVNKAVNVTNEPATLYLPAKNKIFGNEAENGITYTDGNFSMLPMNDWGSKENMIEITAESITFNDLCEQYDLKDIHFLQVDIEGADVLILNSIDFTNINIDIIRYEKWNFDPTQFTRHNNKNQCENYGTNGMKKIEKLLRKQNYILTDIYEKDNNDIIAYKINI